MTTFKSYLTEQMQDPEFRAEYEALESEFAVVQAMIDARKKSGLTQQQLSAKTDMPRGDISKIGVDDLSKEKNYVAPVAL